MNWPSVNKLCFFAFVHPFWEKPLHGSLRRPISWRHSLFSSILLKWMRYTFSSCQWLTNSSLQNDRKIYSIGFLPMNHDYDTYLVYYTYMVYYKIAFNNLPSKSSGLNFIAFRYRLSSWNAYFGLILTIGYT